MLETIREFALEQLAGSGEGDDVRRRHVAWCLSLAREAGASFAERGLGPWGERLAREQDNIRAAFAWLETQDDAETTLWLITALHPVWWFLGIGHGREAFRWLTWALDRGDGVPAALLIRATTVAAQLVRDLGDFAEATSLAEEGAARAAATGDDEGLAESLIVLGGIAQAQGDEAAARARFEEALARYRALGDHRNTARALCRLATLGNLGTVDRPGDPADQALATARCEEALRLFEALGDRAGIARALHGLAFVAYKVRDYPRATSLSHETLRRRWELHEVSAIPASFEDLADVAGMTGQPRPAARLYGAAEALREVVAVPLRPFHLAEYEREVAVTRAALDAAVFAAEWAAGRALLLAEAVAEALAVTVPTAERSQTTPSPAHGLSPRELEVLRLLADGRSDREIGEALFLSPRTVGRHITGILTKLDVPSRTAAATLAMREGIV